MGCFQADISRTNGLKMQQTMQLIPICLMFHRAIFQLKGFSDTIPLENNEVRRGISKLDDTTVPELRQLDA